MKVIKRIDYKKIPEIFSRNNLTPVFNRWGKPDEGCGCPITAYIIDNGHIYSQETLEDFKIEYFERIKELEGFESYYLIGFLHGYDDDEFNSFFVDDEFPGYEEGYEDGLNARKELIDYMK